jgi:hypothetical protein
MQTNCLARATLVKSKKLQGTQFYKLKVAFNVTQINENTGKYIFPVQKQCAYVSGDITIDELGRVLVTVEKVTRTNNIELV